MNKSNIDQLIINSPYEVPKLPPLELSAYDTATLAELAPMVEGKPDVTWISTIDLEDLARKFRMQKIILETARDVFDQKNPAGRGAMNICYPKHPILQENCRKALNIFQTGKLPTEI